MSNTDQQKPVKGKGLEGIGKRPFALWIGALSRLKNPLQVIQIAKAIPEMDFVMVGSPWDKSILDRIMAEKPPNLYYAGPLPDLLKDELIQKCSVGLTTSEYEGFGWIPFEFLTAAKPVLAYPLKVFDEIYGDLIIYAYDLSGFIDILKDLSRKRFKVDINKEAVRRLQTKYDLARAASRIVKALGLSSLVVLTEDVPSGSDSIAGFLIVQWKLWRIIRDSGINLHILSKGRKFSAEFRLTDRTLTIGQSLLPFRKRLDALERSSTPLDRLKRTVINLTLRLAEPLCYVYWYVARRNRFPTAFVIATGASEILAGVFLKSIFRFKLACLIHDAREYTFASGSKLKISFPMRVYFMLYMRALRCADRIMGVSKTALKELSAFYPYHDRLMTIWEE